ncbi:hypothetical protein ACJJTC_002817 [Scirpophaga incertulas]
MPEPALLPEPLIPSLALIACIACVVGAGALTNCSVLATLVKNYRNGLSSIILQLAVADFLILTTLAGPELWHYNSRTWQFGDSWCKAYRGLSEFTSTAASYLIATIALHAIATFNAKVKILERRLKRNRELDEEEEKSSHHSLVASSDTSTPPRTMKLDYAVNTGIAVTKPSVFIWILAASLSIPQFVLATTIDINKSTTLCTLNSKEPQHKINMSSMLAAFNLFLPAIITSVAGIVIICKLKTKKAFYCVEISEYISNLKFSLYLILLYLTLCCPRSVVSLYHVYSNYFSQSYFYSYKSEELDNTMTIITLLFTSIYIFASVIRPVLSLLLLPNHRSLFTRGSHKNVNNSKI